MAFRVMHLGVGHVCSPNLVPCFPCHSERSEESLSSCNGDAEQGSFDFAGVLLPLNSGCAQHDTLRTTGCQRDILPKRRGYSPAALKLWSTVFVSLGAT